MTRSKRAMSISGSAAPKTHLLLNIIVVQLHCLWSASAFLVHNGEVRTQVEFQVKENQPLGTFVGSISLASGIDQHVSQADADTLMYNIITPDGRPHDESGLFMLNAHSGELHTAKLIDRESITVCQNKGECIVSLSVAVVSNTVFKVIEVRVKIIDLNDNAPQFPSQEMSFSVPEGTHAELDIDAATDADKGVYNSMVAGYHMTPTDSHYFHLAVHRNLNDTTTLQIVTMALDREEAIHYRLLIVAMDRGLPPLTGTLTVNVRVTDLNDNTPIFTQRLYSFQVDRHTSVGSVVGRVTATDQDVGQNGQVTYHFSHRQSNSTVGDLFSVNSHTGEVAVKTSLADHSKASFETVVEATDGGDHPLTGQAIVVLYIKD